MRFSDYDSILCLKNTSPSDTEALFFSISVNFRNGRGAQDMTGFGQKLKHGRKCISRQEENKALSSVF